MQKDAYSYGGGLVVLPLSRFVKPGRGDDVIVTIDHESESPYGCLGIGNNHKQFVAARNLARNLPYVEPVMIAVIEDEDDPPKVLTREIIRGGKKHRLAVIFNGALSENPEENSRGSFCVCASERLDPHRQFIKRIMFAPGEMVVWGDDCKDLLMKL